MKLMTAYCAGVLLGLSIGITLGLLLGSPPARSVKIRGRSFRMPTSSFHITPSRN